MWRVCSAGVVMSAPAARASCKRLGFGGAGRSDLARLAPRPRQHEGGALTGAGALRADPPARKLHQAPDDVEAEARAETAAAATGVQAGEFLEEPRGITRPETDAAVTYRELDLATSCPPAGESDAAAADRRNGRERILEEVAQDDIERQRVGHHLQAALDVGADGNAVLRGPLLESRDYSRDGAIEVHRLAPQVDAAAVQPHALEDLRHHALHARQVGEHAVDQGAQVLRRQRSHRHGLERQLQARERRLELMRHQRQEALLLLDHARFRLQGTRDHGDACGQGDDEERALPGVLGDVSLLLGDELPVDVR